MIDKPDVDKTVFARCLKGVGAVPVEGTDTVMEMRRGDVWVSRWSVVRERVRLGDIELV